MKQAKKYEAAILTVAALAACGGLGAGQAMAASGTWSATPADTDWANSANWVSGTIPGVTTGSAVDTATFDATSTLGLTVEPDSGRRVSKIAFNASAGNYIFGADTNSNALTVPTIDGGSGARTITFNSPITVTGNSNVAANTGQVFNFNSQYTGSSGSVGSLAGAGAINLNGGIGGSSAFMHLNINTAHVTIGAATATQNFFIAASSSNTLDLNASGIIGGQANGYSSNSAYGRLRFNVDGSLNVNAANALGGTTPLTAISSNTNLSPVMTINSGQSYTGRSTAAYNTTNQYKRAVGTGDGTLLGNVATYDPDGSGTEYLTASVIGQNGYTVASAASATPILYANNATGSATGSSDVNIITGTLAGNGYIVNSDVTIDVPNIGDAGTTSTVFAQGVTLHKRQVVTGISNGTNHTDYYSGATPANLASYGLTANGAATYGKLSPGASAGAVGTLTMDLGSKGLNIAYAVEDANTQTLLFDLVAPGSSDKVSLLNSTVLNIGAGGLNFDDFVFNLPDTTLAAGTYTLFDSAQAINGSLGSSLSGILDGKLSTLSLANGNQDLVLTVVPEPGTLGLLAMGGLALLARRRRMA